MSAGIPQRPSGLSKTLGASDSRHHRQGEQPNFGPAFKRDANGQITLALELPLIIRNGKPAIDIAALLKALPLAESLVLDGDELGVNMAAAVDDLPTTGATLADVVDKVNEMLASEREAALRET